MSKNKETVKISNSWNNGHIIKVSGPLIIADNMADVKLFDVVHVSDKNLIGEIIELRGSQASIQVYEETSGLRTGDKVVNTGMPLSIELAPGIVGGVFDGIGRPLNIIEQVSGSHITRGVTVPALNRTLVWDFVAEKAAGDVVEPGDILGTVAENEVVSHKIMVPFGVSGKITKIASGKFTITDSIAQIGKTDVTMLQKWPVRRGRPYKNKLTPSIPLVTGTRVIDTFFPVVKGGTAAIPGPFGSGKTVIQHQLAKWADADIVVYVGCGERGNEMTDVLTEFPHLLDPRNNQPIMKRTILIANTSDMPVAAREASVYTGITIAEYFRDMGYNVAIMADSTSRWAEALREMSGRLEEMPGEEGYPAYLSSRLAEFYERAGMVKTLGSNQRTGSITAIGAVSPPGGDLSEPVSQATLRIVKVFWGLSSALAYKRHLPAVDWLTSYSLYTDKISGWYNENINPKFSQIRAAAVKLLQEDAFLDEIVRLVGIDAISDKDKLVMETAKTIREDFLQQNAFHEIDTFTSLEKQFKILRIILDVHDRAASAIDKGTDFYNTLKPDVKEKISRFKYLPEENLETIDELEAQLRAAHIEEGHSE